MGPVGDRRVSVSNPWPLMGKESWKPPHRRRRNLVGLITGWKGGNYRAHAARDPAVTWRHPASQSSPSSDKRQEGLGAETKALRWRQMCEPAPWQLDAPGTLAAAGSPCPWRACAQGHANNAHLPSCVLTVGDSGTVGWWGRCRHGCCDPSQGINGLPPLRLSLRWKINACARPGTCRSEAADTDTRVCRVHTLFQIVSVLFFSPGL